MTDDPASDSPMTPRGSRRVLYVSDPSSIALGILPDPVAADDLRRWVDMLADSGVDIFQQDVFSQGFTTYFRSDRLPYDRRQQHERFLPMIEAGVQPLQILLDHSHKRNMAFLAGFRMNDNHSGENFPSRADFIESHPEFRLADTGAISGSPEERMLDFTFDEVRQFVFEFIEEVACRFDVDGIEMTFRENMFFPISQGRERAHLMTDLVRRVRAMLDVRSESTGRRIQLGARVYDSLEACLDLGLAVPTWIDEGLIDLLSPMDPMFSHFNGKYDEFGALTRNSNCMMYPGMAPWTGQRARDRFLKPAERGVRGSANMTASNQRALAHTFYGAGADGISVYNHFVGHLNLPPLYPQTLQIFYQLRDPQRVARGARHYIFDPTWAAATVYHPKTRMVVLDRNTCPENSRRAPKPSGVFAFCVYEQADQVHGATLMFRGNLTQNDELEVQLNGVPLADGPLGKPDTRFLRPFPDIRWFPLPSDAIAWGENELSITLAVADPEATGEIVIDEVEVWVQPK